MRAASWIGAAAIVGTLVGVPVVSHAAQTIVGTWAPDPAACTPVGGMISIGPLSLTADETSCTFRDVSRSGDVVTWHGRCSDGFSQKTTTVVATLNGGRLTFTMNGGRNGPYRRCKPL